jgi:hypothetical protein
MKIKTIKVYADPGHAWAKVSKKELEKLGIQKEISGFSYERNGFAFLEEDSDLSKYIAALREKDFSVKFKESHTNKRSKIRNYESYFYEVNA